MSFELFHDNCADKLQILPPASVDLIVTSPPYFLGKEYEKDWTLEYFAALMRDVFKGCNRVMKPGAYFVVNFGDCYNSGNRFYDAEVPSVFPASLWYYQWGEEQNFDLQATRIWRKKFAKLSIPFVCNTHPRNIFDYEHIWTFRKHGGGKEVVYDRKLSQRGVLGEDWGSAARLDIHCAAFPLELPAWAIRVYSKEGDTVLDPFMGSATTGVAAISLKRNFIGIEKELKYFNIAQQRLQEPIDI